MTLPEYPGVSSQSMQAALAAELACRLVPVSDILTRFSLSAEQLKQLMAVPAFRNMVIEYRREWDAPKSSKDRIRLKAALATEDGIAELHRIFYDMEVNPNVRLGAYEQLVKLADMLPKANTAATGSAFSVTINIPGADATETAMTSVTVENASTHQTEPDDGHELFPGEGWPERAIRDRVVDDPGHTQDSALTFDGDQPEIEDYEQ